MIIPKELLQNKRWGPLLYIFQENERLKMYFNSRYIDVKNRTVKVRTLKLAARPWSESEKFMLDLALHLFNEGTKVNLSNMDYLDSSNLAIAFTAMKMRFGKR